MLSPFGGFRDLESQMNRMLAQTLGQLPQTTTQAEWAPAVDVIGENGDMVIRAELPGMKREDVDVTVSNGVLSISGEREEEEEKEGSGYLVKERRYGSFRRNMLLPEGIDESQIRASFKDGLLEVTVKGAVAAVEKGPKKIEIEE